MDNSNSRKNGPVVIVTAADKLALAKAALQAAKDAMKTAKAEVKAEGGETSTISRAAKLSALVTAISAMTPEQAKAAALVFLTAETEAAIKLKGEKAKAAAKWLVVHADELAAKKAAKKVTA